MPQKIPSSALALQTTVTAVSGTLATPNATLSGFWKLDQPLKGSLNGNANTATALTPGAKINGYTFTGAGDITLSTDNVGEGSTNLYFTNARARSAVSASGSISYSASTGVFSYSTPNTDGIGEGGTNLYFTNARALAAAGGQSVGTTANVQFASLFVGSTYSAPGANCILASGNITAYSDRTLKENIEPITNALSKVKEINGVTYTRNDLEDKLKKYSGIIAQDVEKARQEAIDSGKIKDKVVSIKSWSDFVKKITC